MQHAPQSSGPAGVVASLVEGFVNCFLAAALLRIGENLFRVRTNLFVAHVGNLGGKPAQQFLLGVGVQLRFELRPVNVLATEDPLLKHAFVFVTSTEGILEELGDELEMLTGFIGDAALGVAGIVAAEAVAASAAG